MPDMPGSPSLGVGWLAGQAALWKVQSTPSPWSAGESLMRGVARLMKTN
jgi:hypothetical protein